MKAKELIERLKRPIVEMANLRPEKTGLSGMGLYVSTKQGSHGARVKVFPFNKLGVNSLAYILTVENDPKLVVQPKDNWLSSKELSQVKFWIWKNKIDLLRLWNLDPAKVPYEDITNLIYGLEKV